MPKRIFNQELHDDIIKLRQIKEESDHMEYLEAYRLLADKHQISSFTVYREMQKEVPGEYIKSRHPSMVKISKKELDKLAELTIQKCSDKVMMNKLSEYKGFDYTPLRLRKAKAKLYRYSKSITDPKIKVVHHFYDPKMINGLKISPITTVQAGGINARGNNAPAEASKDLPEYSGNAARLFRELAQVSDAEPDAVFKLEFSGTVHYVHGSVIIDCLDHIAASSVNGGRSIRDSSRLTIETLLRRQLDYATRKGYITPLELKQLAAIQKSLHQLDESLLKKPERSFTFDELMHVVNYYSPSASRDIVANVITSHPFINRKILTDTSKPAPPEKNSPLPSGPL